MENVSTRKYDLLVESRIVDGRVLHRIRAARDFYDVKKGDLGGFIEREDNLSHDNNCWVYDEACIFDNAVVSENAHIRDHSKVYDYAQVRGYSSILDYAKVHGYTQVYDEAIVKDHSKVFGCSRIYDNACIINYTNLYSEDIGGDAIIRAWLM